MLTEQDLKPYIDLSRRRALLNSITEFSVEGELAKYREDAHTSDAAYPELPIELWGHVALLVPVPPEHEGGETDWIRVVATEMTMAEHSKAAIPDLINVDYVAMNERQEQQYSGFCQAVAQYLELFKLRIDARISTMKQHVKEIKLVLPGYYFDDVSKTERKRLAAADPFVRELERAIEADRQHSATLGVRVKSLQNRTQQVSRDLSRRVMEANLGGLTGHGSGMSRGPRPERPGRAVGKIP